MAKCKLEKQKNKKNRQRFIIKTNLDFNTHSTLVHDTHFLQHTLLIIDSVTQQNV